MHAANVENYKFLNLFETSRQKVPLTVLYCMVFWNFGICVAIFGPTLLDLACQTGSSLTTLSWLYFIQNTMSLVGCLVSGIVLKYEKQVNLSRIKTNTLLLTCTLTLPMCVALMPVAGSIHILGLIMAILGFNMGCIDNLGNLAILKLHGNNVSPFIQGLHFFYGLGALLTPVVVQLFLNSSTDTLSAFNCYSPEDVEEYLKLQGIQVLKNQTTSSLPIPIDVLTSTYHAKSKIKYAFWILAFVQLPVPLCLFLFKIGRFANYILYDEIIDEKIFNTYTSIDDENYDALFDTKEREKPNAKLLPEIFTKVYRYISNVLKNSGVYVKMIVLVALMVFIFDGLQATHGGFIFSYVVEKYDLSVATNKSTSKPVQRFNHKRYDDAYITASFWAFFSLGRLVSVFLATKWTPNLMIIVDLIGCLFSTILMLISAIIDSQNKLLIYLSTCMFGLFLSNTTPCSYSLAEMKIGMTPTMTTSVIISAAIGEMLLPALVGSLFEAIGPISFIVVELVTTIFSCIVFVQFVRYTKAYKNPTEQNQAFAWYNDNDCSNNDNRSDENEFKQESANLMESSIAVKCYTKPRIKLVD